MRSGRRRETDHSPGVIKAALHVVPDEVEAAYARSALFERRRDDGELCEHETDDSVHEWNHMSGILGPYRNW